MEFDFLQWEGNDQVLQDFDTATFDAAAGTSGTRVGLITHLTGFSIGYPVGSFAASVRVVGNMIFDPVRMYWISTLPPEEDEPDVFPDLADNEHDNWEEQGSTIHASQELHPSAAPTVTADSSCAALASCSETPKLKLDGHQASTKLFTFSVHTTTGAKVSCLAQSAILIILVSRPIDNDHDVADPPFTKKGVDVYFPPEATNDFPVTVQVSKKYAIIFLVMKYGFIHLYDLEPGACIYMNRISGETIFVTAEHDATNVIIGVKQEGTGFECRRR
ncbi:hypothetical protein A0H81_14161 [Grifola frondosa]|uniref:Uncharacterized protein n=1 Tax=Grifola frondosa TaxID=5627 RepID=A0A1C7LPB2_GRIFR|nr:hypothetical protein A0H81_14161 [Grifola frondosa]